MTNALMSQSFTFRPDRPMIRDERGWNAQSPAMFRLLGLLPGSHLPADGMAPRIIQGIKVWVEPNKEHFPNASYFHRVRAECPLCGKHLSAGRLHQHKCKK